ncbi:hypothetical protein ACI2LF_12740 [Kribbella sp. NPDC020789]
MKRSRIFAALVLAVITFLPAPAAQAETTKAFLAQAHEAGLTAQQAAILQDRVDGYLQQVGGRQVAANEIDLYGATLRLTLPGETRVRELTAGPRAAAQVGCRYLHFCAWRDPYFVGDLIEMYECKDWSIPWLGHGSWENNQSAHTIAKFKSNDGVTRWTDGPGGSWSYDDDADWSWVHWVRNCG